MGILTGPIGIGVGVVLVLTVLLALLFRNVVKTNMVHIVQSRKKTTSYGAGLDAGNVYYKWPSWVPRMGVTVIPLPVSNFDLSLRDYEAYDKDRVPFKVDVVAFFRIEDTGEAAKRVESVEELESQLSQIVQGAVRKVLASDKIDAIMLERAQFGDKFTEEVEGQLKEWGIKSVKAMELMDIRDNHDSNVIQNIMAKKSSFIEMESRVEVATNKKLAETAEIEAKQVVDIRSQEAEEAVGQRTAEKEKTVGIANEQSRQEVLTQTKTTRERDMEVKRVEQVKQAEITREEQVVAAQQDKETVVIRADGQLDAKRREAEGIQAIGEAEAEAKKAMELAPVAAQIALAEKIAELPEYQDYLKTIEAVKAYTEVGSEQARALQEAEVKIISNAGNPVEGAQSVMDLISSKGGTNIAAAFEALAQSPIGEKLLSGIGASPNGSKPSKENGEA